MLVQLATLQTSFVILDEVPSPPLPSAPLRSGLSPVLAMAVIADADSLLSPRLSRRR